MKKVKENIYYSREKVIARMCKERGWNPKELTSKQMIFIVTSQDFKNLH